MKKLLVGMILLLGVVAVVNAEEAAPAQDMGVTVDLSYTTKYIWRGFDLLSDDDGAFQPSLNFDLGNGFNANVWMSYPSTGGHVDMTEYQYTLAYNGSALEDSAWKTNYQVGWRYYDFIKESSDTRDVQEVYLTGSMPALTGCGVVPHFGVFQMWAAQGNSVVNDWTGTIYLVGFGYDFTLDNAPELPMTFTWDIVYNDGTGGATVDHDWSHMVWGLKTTIDCPMTGAKLVPAVYFQNSFDTSVNTEDEFWASLSYSFSF